MDELITVFGSDWRDSMDAEAGDAGSESIIYNSLVFPKPKNSTQTNVRTSTNRGGKRWWKGAAGEGRERTCDAQLVWTNQGLLAIAPEQHVVIVGVQEQILGVSLNLTRT